MTTPAKPALPEPYTDRPEMTGVGEWCAPGPAATQVRRWLLRFEDTDCREAVYEDEATALQAFARAEARGWNCHLFAHAPRRASIDAAVAELTAERDALKQTLHDELDSNLRLRELGGARPDEPMTVFLERAFRERDAAVAAVAEARAVPEKFAPVQGYSAGIPWSLHLEAYDAYCKQHGPQRALIEGGCRGGFGVKELDVFVPGWRERTSEIGRLKAEVARLRAATPSPTEPAMPAERVALSEERIDEIFDAHQEAPTMTFRYYVARAVIAEYERLNGICGAPFNAISKLVEWTTAEAVRNGANSVSMPDEIVEVAAWLHGITPAQSKGERS